MEFKTATNFLGKVVESQEKKKEEFDIFYERELRDFVRYDIDNPEIQYVKKGEEGREKLENLYAIHKQTLAEEREKKRIAEEQQKIEWEKRKIELERQKVYNEFCESLPKEYENANLSQIPDSDNIKGLKENKNAIVLGKNGIGKTYLMYSLGRYFSEKGEVCHIEKALSLLSRIKAEKDPVAYINENLIDKYQHLYIDEIDKIFASESDILYLGYLVDERHHDSKYQTILVGNGDIATLNKKLGNSIIDRLTMNGGLLVQSTSTKNWRENG